MRWGSSAGYRSQNETSYLREGDILRGLLNQPGNRDPEQGGDPGTGRPERTRPGARCRNSGGYSLGIGTISPSRSSRILSTN